MKRNFKCFIESSNTNQNHLHVVDKKTGKAIVFETDEIQGSGDEPPMAYIHLVGFLNNLVAEHPSVTDPNGIVTLGIKAQVYSNEPDTIHINADTAKYSVIA